MHSIQNWVIDNYRISEMINDAVELCSNYNRQNKRR